MATAERSSSAVWSVFWSSVLNSVSSFWTSPFASLSAALPPLSLRHAAEVRARASSGVTEAVLSRPSIVFFGAGKMLLLGGAAV